MNVYCLLALFKGKRNKSVIRKFSLYSRFLEMYFKISEKFAKSDFLKFQLSIDFAEAISDSRLRHGVARLLWEKFVDEPFKATAMLMEKTGRAPKEREARQQLGFGESKVVSSMILRFSIFGTRLQFDTRSVSEESCKLSHQSEGFIFKSTWT